MTLFEAGKAGMICTPHIWGKWAMYVQGSDTISYPVPMPPTGGKTPSWATPSHLFRNAPYPTETMDFVVYVFGPQNEAMTRALRYAQKAMAFSREPRPILARASSSNGAVLAGVCGLTPENGNKSRPPD